jgi:plastocyanin
MNPKTQVVHPISRTPHNRLASRMLAPIAGVLIGWISCANAQVRVTDDGLSFSPDPVTILVSDSVLWVDDGTGPYTITSDSGAWKPFQTPGGIIFNQPGTYPYHDDNGDFGTIQVNLNIPPSVTITNPASNAVFAPPGTFLFGADASDTDSDGLSDVEFFVGTNMVDDVFSSPFTTTVTNLAAGTYTLTAIAFDNAGATATNSITITVSASQQLALAAPRLLAGQIVFNAAGLTVGKTNVLLTATDLPASRANWVALTTNVASAPTMSFTNVQKLRSFFRLIQLP